MEVAATFGIVPSSLMVPGQTVGLIGELIAG